MKGVRIDKALKVIKYLVHIYDAAHVKLQGNTVFYSQKDYAVQVKTRDEFPECCVPLKPFFKVAKPVAKVEHSYRLSDHNLGVKWVDGLVEGEFKVPAYGIEGFNWDWDVSEPLQSTHTLLRGEVEDMYHYKMMRPETYPIPFIKALYEVKGVLTPWTVNVYQTYRTLNRGDYTFYLRRGADT